MAEVKNTPVDPIDDNPRGQDATATNKSDDSPGGGSGDNDSPPPPHHRHHERDSRERRDDPDFDRPPPNRYYDLKNRGGGGGGRDRDYGKRSRGKSPDSSPPPPYHRDHRRNNNLSPPPRRSPPYHPFKRSRRDDGVYDGRRGSPRGRGGGCGDRRFSFDYPGGYDREVSGRLGYGDDRPHGRFRSGGFPGGGPSDWESGRGGYAVLSNAGNAQSYQEYKSEYISTQKRTYFEAHKDDEWLKNKYHPTNLLSVIERRNELARKVAKDFLLDLHSGNLDMGPGANALSMNKSGQTSEPNSENETDDGGKRWRHEKIDRRTRYRDGDQGWITA